MRDLEKPHTLIPKEKIEKLKDVDYVGEKLNRLGIPADKENINALLKLVSMGAVTDATLKVALDEKNPGLITKKIDRYKKWYEIAKTKEIGLTDDEAVVAVKFLDEIKSRFRKESRGEKPRDYIKSFKDILRRSNITLTLSDMNSLNNFPIKNEINAKELKENMEKLVEQGVTSTDSLFEKLSEIYGEDEEWLKYLVQKNIQKREILEEYLKSYVKEPAMYFLRHHTIERIEMRALYRELVVSGLVKKIEEKIKIKEKKRGRSILNCQ